MWHWTSHPRHVAEKAYTEKPRLCKEPRILYRESFKSATVVLQAGCWVTDLPLALTHFPFKEVYIFLVHSPCSVLTAPAQLIPEHKNLESFQEGTPQAPRTVKLFLNPFLTLLVCGCTPVFLTSPVCGHTHLFSTSQCVDTLLMYQSVAHRQLYNMKA